MDGIVSPRAEQYPLPRPAPARILEPNIEDARKKHWRFRYESPLLSFRSRRAIEEVQQRIGGMQCIDVICGGVSIKFGIFFINKIKINVRKRIGGISKDGVF